MGEKKYRRIGWVVEWRAAWDEEWYALRTTVSCYEETAIKKYAKNHNWKEEKSNKFARCVPIFTQR